MNFLQKVYFNDKPLILTTESSTGDPATQDYLTFSGATAENIQKAMYALNQQTTTGAIITDTSEDALHKQLNTMFRSIDAAGGLVYDASGAVLMIFRRGKWDIPKGKLDAGETIHECALREVQEETGLRSLVLGEKICDSYHIYLQKKEYFLKRTAWYKMSGSSAETLAPQTEEDILEARWVSEKDMAPIAAGAYTAIREVLKLAGLKW
jgi:8-oxo-dGTP pyrophosphatase MutT (NUDIX family)